MKYQNAGSHRPSVAHAQMPRLLSMVTSFDPAMLLLVSYDAVTAVSSITVMGIWGICGFGARRISTDLMIAPRELTMCCCMVQCCFGSGSDLVGVVPWSC